MVGTEESTMGGENTEAEPQEDLCRKGGTGSPSFGFGLG